MNNQDLNIIFSGACSLSDDLLDTLEDMSNVRIKRMYELSCRVLPVKDAQSVGDYAKLEVASIQFAEKLINKASTILWHAVGDEKKRKKLADMCEKLELEAHLAIQQSKDDGDNQ